MNLGFTEMLFLFLLALLIFGPAKLPEIGKQIGRALSEFKRASNEFKNQIETEVQQLQAVEEERNRTIAPAESPFRPADGMIAAGPEPGDGGATAEQATAGEPPVEGAAQRKANG